MLDPDFDSMEKYADVESLNAYQELLLAGTSEKEAFKIVKAKSRDNSRTPMQWDSGEYSGFSTVDPWLSLGNTANEINVAKELQEGSIFNYYQRLIKLRKEYPIIAEGSYEAFYLIIRKFTAISVAMRIVDFLCLIISFHRKQQLICLMNFKRAKY